MTQKHEDSHYHFISDPHAELDAIKAEIQMEREMRFEAYPRRYCRG